jgi:soluble lytic murein transglycosylase-like protein
MLAKCFFAAFLLLCSAAQAGKQLEEPLANSVRTALTASLQEKTSPRFAPKDDFAAHNYQTWLKRADQLLAKRRKDLSPVARADLLETAYYEATRAGLEPALVLGLIQVESNFRSYAISHADARGLMQVMPFWTRLVGDGDTRKLFDSHVNLRYGCTILRHYLDIERGNLFRALGRWRLGKLGSRTSFS